MADAGASAEVAGGGRPRTRADAAATRARLRRLIANIERRPRSSVVAEPERLGRFDDEAPPRDLLVDAVRRETSEGPFTYREVHYPLSYETGRQPLEDIRALSGETLALLAPEEGSEGAGLGDLYFLDIETTGLGGAGAIAFLVATARIDVTAADGAGVVVLSQYLAESPPEEAALLEALIEDARFVDEPVLVTYNGRTFDSPLLDERATMHRRRAGFEALRQLDLLRPARTAYRGLLPNCKLGTLEVEVLGMGRPSEDVPGAEVPAWYFRFLRTGDRRMLAPIIEHNELDVVGMVGLLASHAAQLDSGRDASPRDALGIGRLLAARGDGRAERYLAEGVRGASTDAHLEEGLLRLAALQKREGRRAEAAELWHRALELPTRARLGPLVELAKYYEHQRREFEVAIELAEQARQHIERWLRPRDPVRGRRVLGEIEHRLSRLHSRAERARTV